MLFAKYFCGVVAAEAFCKSTEGFHEYKLLITRLTLEFNALIYPILLRAEAIVIAVSADTFVNLKNNVDIIMNRFIFAVKYDIKK